MLIERIYLYKFAREDDTLKSSFLDCLVSWSNIFRCRFVHVKCVECVKHTYDDVGVDDENMLKDNLERLFQRLYGYEYHVPKYEYESTRLLLTYKN